MALSSAERLRFWDKALIGDDCWPWHGSSLKGGYGTFWLGVGRPRLAHRIAYEDLVGPIPEGLDIDHLCRVRNCVNPAHMEPVTHRENVLRGETVAAKHAAVTHCPAGHPYDEANTYWRLTGGRTCRACDRISRAAARLTQINKETPQWR